MLSDLGNKDDGDAFVYNFLEYNVDERCPSPRHVGDSHIGNSSETSESPVTSDESGTCDDIQATNTDVNDTSRSEVDETLTPNQSMLQEIVSPSQSSLLPQMSVEPGTKRLPNRKNRGIPTSTYMQIKISHESICFLSQAVGFK